MVKKPNTKKYTPNSKEKYMCAKHKKFFTEELLNWKRDIIKANNLGNILKKNSTANALKGGCLLKPQSKLLPQAKASIVSRGRFVLDNVGIIVHSNKCEIRNK